MAVKSERSVNSKPLDDHLARAIGKAPIFVIKIAEDFPGQPQIIVSQPIDLRQFPIEKLFADLLLRGFFHHAHAAR
ncbi:MAG: hypothetical protein ACREBD_38735 [Blastocatellia bacterium]